jgi:hypothetical protein
MAEAKQPAAQPKAGEASEPVPVPPPGTPPPDPHAAAGTGRDKAMYSADELAVVAQERFGVHPDVVRGAFMQRGVTELTLTDATALVAEYAEYRPAIPGQEQEA